MKKALFSAMALIALSASISSCQKCSKCTDDNGAVTKYCDKSNAELAIAEGICTGGGGDWED